MNITDPLRSALVSAAVVLLFAASAPAQQKASSNRVALKKFVDATNNLSPEVRKHLSRGMQSYLRYANAVVNGTAPSAEVAGANSLARKKKGGGNPFNLIQVSDPALDPAAQGYTQNTSSSAWCGNAVVVGYEDSGAFFRTDPSEAFGVPVSLDGVSFSTNAGKSFTDLGFLTPGTFSANALMGDPSVTCSSPTHFQYASILNTTTPDGMNFIIGPSVSFSTDGGRIWSAPLQVVPLDDTTQLADSPWLAVDPTNPQRLYLSYTQVDFLGCVSIDVVTSADAGKKWSAPVVVDQECPPTQPPFNPQNTVAGSRVIVGPDGKAHVAYEFFPGFSPDVPQINAIRFASSANHGATFSKPLKVANLVPSGTGAELNGHLVVVDESPQLAVDRSAGHSRGTIYVTYPDGRHHVVPDANSPSGTYAYPDVFVAKSTNSGRSFAVLGAISPAPKDFTGLGRDQFLPAIAVDNDGEVAVCYYDRRNDRADLRVDRFCSVSQNQGKHWKDQQASKVNWLPSFNVDPLDPTGFAISEYDALTSDFLRHNDGFFGAFIIEINSNQNVVATKF
jgi:hypothetical protein